MVYEYCTDAYTIAGVLTIDFDGVRLKDGDGYTSIGVSDVLINADGKIEVIFAKQGQVFSAAVTAGGRMVRHEGMMVGVTGAVDKITLYIYDPEVKRLLDLNVQSDYDRVASENDTLIHFDVKHVKTE